MEGRYRSITLCTRKSASHIGPNLNWRIRKNDKKTGRTTDLRRLIADTNLRCEVANAISAAITQIPDGTLISDIVTDTPDFRVSILVKLTPHFKPPRGVHSWSTEPGIEAEMDTA